ncbi:CATRA system-associated protein [Streptomyces cyaneofuscatus]|uniref:CATRA system-associated protein n=1 Tax=Streptomyces TaxID=1883 RepID=UPI00136EB786|nr:CATRA system-associated protein [Streptomyces sp. SID2119]MYW31405.1 hypothetical protein [Streptomyces sp. SID2119]
MSTSDRAASIGRRTHGATRLVLELIQKEWLLPPWKWEEIAEQLDELSAALAAGDLAAVDVLTGELEAASGPRVSRIGAPPDGEPSEGDRRVPLPEEYRERVVALVHTLTTESAPGGSRPEPSERN